MRVPLMPRIVCLTALAAAALLLAGPALAQFEHPMTPVAPPIMTPPVIAPPVAITPITPPPSITPAPNLTPTPTVGSAPVVGGDPPDGGQNSAPIVIVNAASGGGDHSADGSVNATNAADTPSSSHGVPLWIVIVIVIAAVVAVVVALNRSRR